MEFLSIYNAIAFRDMKKMNQDIRRLYIRGVTITCANGALYGRKIISLDFIRCNNNPCFPSETDSLPRNPAKIHRQSDCKPSRQVVERETAA